MAKNKKFYEACKDWRDWKVAKFAEQETLAEIWSSAAKKLYEACKCWRDWEVEEFAEPATLSEIWSRATKEDTTGNAASFRKHVLRNYEEELRYGG